MEEEEDSGDEPMWVDWRTASEDWRGLVMLVREGDSQLVSCVTGWTGSSGDAPGLWGEAMSSVGTY